MGRPSLRVKLREVSSQLDQLSAWQGLSLESRVWAERLNELRFVRATLAWEEFLEQSFICYLRGSQSIHGRAYALQVSASATSSNAQQVAIGNNQFGKWLNEHWTLMRANALFQGQHPYQPLAAPSFTTIRKLRNRIVHRSDNVRLQFRTIATSIYGSWPRGMTPGRLLTEVENGSPRIDNYLNLMKATATLIAS